MQPGVRQPEIDHDRIGVLVFVLAFGAAVSEQRFRWIDVPTFAGGIVLTLPRRRGAGCRRRRLARFRFRSRTLRRTRHRLPVFGGRWLRRVAAALHRELDHLKVAIVLVALVPRARGEHAQCVFAFGHVAQFERLIDFVICLVRLIVEDHVNVIALAGRRIFVRHVTL